MTEKRVRVGIIGCGKIAVTHAAGLANIPEAEFTATCDVDLSRAQALAAEHNVPHAFGSLDELFAANVVDAVLVCTPHPTHEAAVVAAARAGVHVLCEKPIAITLGEADRMIAACDENGVRFGVIFQRRFWPAAQRMRQAIDDGKLGNLTLGECTVRIWRDRAYFGMDPWRGKWATEGGGVLMNQAVHSIDHFQWYMGKATEVYGKIATLRHGDYIDVEDTAVATITFANGALGVLQATSTFQPAFGFRVAIHGDAGTAISYHERNEGELGVNDLWTIPGEEHLREIWLAEDDGKVGFPLYHQLQIQEFCQAILADRDPLVTGRDARNSLEIILAIYQSSRTGVPVKLPMSS